MKKKYFFKIFQKKTHSKQVFYHLVLNVWLLLPLYVLIDLLICSVKHQEKKKQALKWCLGKQDKILFIKFIFLLFCMRSGSNKGWIISCGSSETLTAGSIMAVSSCRDKWFQFDWESSGNSSVKWAYFEGMNKLSLRDLFQLPSFQVTIAQLVREPLQFFIIALFIYVYWIVIGCKIYLKSFNSPWFFLWRCKCPL